MTFRTTWSEPQPDAGTPPSQRRFVWAAVVAVVLAIGVAAGVAIAIAMLSGDRTPPGFVRAEGPLVAGFLPDRAAEVVVEGQGARVALGRRDNGWVLSSRDGYPVRPGAVEDLLRRIAAAEMMYAASRDAPPPATAYGLGSDKGVVVTVRDGQGNRMLRARLGRSISEPGGEAMTVTAVQRDGDNRIVLARGEIGAHPALDRWTSTFVMHYLAPQIGEARPASPKGGASAKVRQDDLGRIQTEGRPAAESGEPAAGKVVEVTRALENVRFEDVRAAGAVPGDGMPIGTAQYRTRDGVGITVHLTRVDRQAVWARFEVDLRGASGEGAQIAERLRDQVDGWAFRLPKETADRMIVARDQLVP